MPPLKTLTLIPCPSATTAVIAPLASLEKTCLVWFWQIYAWYDNEWGYSKRMAELTCKVARTFFS